MVDHEKRIQAAEALLRFLRGETTNRDLEKSFPIKSGDRALRAIREQVWFLYDDFKVHKLEGRFAIDGVARETLLRCIRFLGTGDEFKWPVCMGLFEQCLMMIGLHRLAEKIDRKRLARIGDFNYWPFRSRAEYESASNSRATELPGTPGSRS